MATFLPYPEPVVQPMIQTPPPSLFTPILRNRRPANHSYELHTDEYGVCPSDDKGSTSEDWYELEPGIRLPTSVARELVQSWPGMYNPAPVGDHARCCENCSKMPTTEFPLVVADDKNTGESCSGAGEAEADPVLKNLDSAAGADLDNAAEALKKLPPRGHSSSGDSDFLTMDHVESESGMLSRWDEYPPKSSRATTVVNVTRPLLVGGKSRKDTSTDSIEGMEEDEVMCQGIV